MKHIKPFRPRHAHIRHLPARLACLALLLSSCLLPTVPVLAADSVAKDETVYGFLKEDGAVREVLVVNRLIAPAPGMATDPGNYLSVRAMVAAPDAELSPGRVTWDLSDLDGRDFYYEGVMKSALPVTVQAAWTLDGKPTAASALSGANGQVAFTMKVTPDESLPADLRDGFLTQIQASVDLDRIALDEAKGAAQTIVGHTATLAWTLLPGETGEFSFSGAARDFAIEPIVLSLVRYDVSGSFDVGELTDGVDRLADGSAELAGGADDLAAGSTELADGLVSLKEGIHAFRGGIGRLSGGVADLSDGIVSYAAGLDQFGAGLSQAASGFGPLVSAFSELRSASGQLLAGIDALHAGLSELSAGHAQLAGLANGLLGSADPTVQQLAGGVVAEQAAIDRIRDGLGQQAAGLRQFDAGLAQAMAGLEQASSGIATLPGALTGLQAGLARLDEGARQLRTGAAASAAGAAKLDDETAPLPEGSRKLADGQRTLAEGQRELADGLATMRDQVLELADTGTTEERPVISFADRHTEIRSLQYVIQLPGIDPREEPEAEGPRDVRLPWYEEFWNRLTNLF